MNEIIVSIAGPAGSGKSHVAAVIAKALEDAGISTVMAEPIHAIPDYVASVMKGRTVEIVQATRVTYRFS